MGLDICLSGLLELWHTVGWSLMGAVSNHLGDSSYRLGEGVLDSTRFLLELSWHSEGGGGDVTAIQNYNESRGHPEAEVEEEKSMSCTYGS